jgi:hypothetical protein
MSKAFRFITPTQALCILAKEKDMLYISHTSQGEEDRLDYLCRVFLGERLSLNFLRHAAASSWRISSLGMDS